MGIITYNGISSEELGLVVEHYPNYKTPTRDLEFIHIPGRNGDLVYDHGGYQNVRKEYEIAFVADLKKANKEEWNARAQSVSRWLRSANGYARLTDDYESDYYFMAAYEDGLDIENILMQAGRIKISFNCKPQRYYKKGDVLDYISFGGDFTRTLTFQNPSIDKAYPRINISFETSYDWEFSGDNPNDAYLPTLIMEGSGPDGKTFALKMQGWKKSEIPGLRRPDEMTTIQRRIVFDSENRSIYMDPSFYGGIVEIRVNPMKYSIFSTEGYEFFPYFVSGENQLSVRYVEGAGAGVSNVTVPIERAMIEVYPRWYTI